ncbi:PHD finger protein 24-like isoform X1 [Rhopilema esculentum]|uniref:PHD finger protein 24-like isoform X1 n=2 Tax=Rhopilema esculentum TaxID=499914 RepID=UPI0031D0E549
MGMVISLRRSSKTSPDLGVEKFNGSASFDTDPTELPNPFAKSTQPTVVPFSLKQFMELSEKYRENVSFYADATVNNMMLESDEVCFICNVYSTSTDIFTCRVCMKSFHEGCLRKIGDLSAEVARLHANAISKSSIGWSCYKCSNLSLLLTEDEMHEIMDLFDDYDSNQDTQISLEEYVQFKEMQFVKKTKDRCPDDLKKLASDEFCMIDRDKTGTIDWWEFLNHESIKMLARRDKEELVAILSPKEVSNVRDKFKALDVDNDGRITEYEAQKAFFDWFGKLAIKDQSSDTVNGRHRSLSKSLSEETVKNHAHNMTMLVMEADADRNRYVDWEEFLKNEAIYIISSRPNLSLPMLVKE